MNLHSSYLAVMLLMLMLTDTLNAQQTEVSAQSVNIQGIDELLQSLRRIENQIDRFSRVRWEYRFLQRNLLGNTESVLARLGADGWELVSATVEEGYILKRAVLPR